MFKLLVLAAMMALATAAPGLIAAPGLVGAPLAYSAYAAPALAAPAYAAVAAPAPYSYVSGHTVSYSVEPVEQHGYRIAY